MRIEYRKPNKEDGGAIWSLVRRAGTLDVNSAYSYIMLCEFFADTCAVVEVDGRIVGMVTGYRKPGDAATLFVWQVAVDPSMRGNGVAGRLLDELLLCNTGIGIRYIEATISPSNAPSQNLFRSMARERKAIVEVSECFPSRLFPGNGHEDEMLFRIGPIVNLPHKMEVDHK
jgi:L-2,4-diaminobutyric acid acetyltransferase